MRVDQIVAHLKNCRKGKNRAPQQTRTPTPRREPTPRIVVNELRRSRSAGLGSASDALVRWEHWSRTFAKDRIATHYDIWTKRREREVYNMKAVRTEEIAQKWLTDHESLLEQIQRDKLENSEFITCPHCKRRYNKVNAERHIVTWLYSYPFTRTKRFASAAKQVISSGGPKIHKTILTTVDFEEPKYFVREEEETQRVETTPEPEFTTQKPEFSKFRIPHHYMNDESKKLLQKSTQRLHEHVINRSNAYSYVSWPHWNRKFAPRAAENHIPICKGIENRPKNKIFEKQQQAGLKPSPSQESVTPTSRKIHDSLFSALDQSISKSTLRYECEVCNARYVEGDKFCSNCGSNLNVL